MGASDSKGVAYDDWVENIQAMHGVTRNRHKVMEQIRKDVPTVPAFNRGMEEHNALGATYCSSEEC